MHGLVFARHWNWTHALQAFAVLQEWGSFWGSVSFIMNRSPHILPCVQSCIIRDAACRPNSVSLPSAPLVCLERLSVSRNIVNGHGKTVLYVPSSLLSFPDLVPLFCRRQSNHLCLPWGNLQPQVRDVFAIDHVVDRGCLQFGTHESPTSFPQLLVR